MNGAIISCTHTHTYCHHKLTAVIINYYYILARSANLPTGLYILLALISLFFYFFIKFENNYLRIHWTDFFLQFFFHQMIGICVNVNNLDLFFRFLKGRCHGNRFYGKFWVYAFIRQSGVKNGLQCRHFNSKIFNGNILATFYANMMKIGLVTPDSPRDYEGNKWNFFG